MVFEGEFPTSFTIGDSFSDEGSEEELGEDKEDREDDEDVDPYDEFSEE